MNFYQLNYLSKNILDKVFKILAELSFKTFAKKF